ncbi:MAG: orotate phosphoribosyltransferase [Candidatus Muiribacteriota bacterium]
MDHKTEVASMLLQTEAVKLSPKKPFEFASGILSPIYCDNRVLISYPEKRKKIVNFFLELIKEKKINFDVIAGTATAGIPYAAWISDKLNLPMVYVRGEKKSHGKKNRVEGFFNKGASILLIEDLVSTGGSLISAVDALRELNGEVKNCFSIFTYEMQKADKNLAEKNIQLNSLSDFSTLIEVAVQKKYILPEQKDTVLKWAEER